MPMQPVYRGHHGFVEERAATRHAQIFAVAGLLIVFYIISRFIKTDTEQYESVLRTIFIISGMAAMIFCFINIELALAAYVFVVPLTNYALPGLPYVVTIGDAYILILALAWAMRMLVSRGERIQGSNLDRLIFLFIVLSVVSMFGSTNLPAAGVELFQTIEYFMVSYYLFQNVIRKREEMDNVVLALALSALLYSSYGIIEYFSQADRSTRISATFGHFNAFGAYLAFMIPLFFNLFVTEKKIRWRRSIYFLTMVTCGVAIMFTFSRGAWIGVLGALIFSAWIRGLGQFIKIFSLLTVMVIIMSVLLPHRFIGRAASITEIQDDSTQSRIQQYNMAFEIMMEKPLFGVGIEELGHYAEARGTPTLGEIHNVFLFIAAESGIPSMVVFVLIIFQFVNNMIRGATETRSPDFRGLYVALFSAIAAFMIVNLTAYQLVRGLGVFIGIFLGMSVAARRIEEYLILTDTLEEDPDDAPILRTPALIGHVTSQQ